MIAATKFSGALLFASKELKNDRDIVMIAITQNSLAFQFALDEIRNDMDIIRRVSSRNMSNYDRLCYVHEFKNNIY